MKLLFVLSEYLPESGGGIISYYSGVLPRLVAVGHSVDVLVAAMEFVNRPGLSIEGVRISYLKTEFLEKSQIGFERYQFGYPTFAAFLPLAWAAYEQTHHGADYDLVETTDFPLLFAPWVISGDSPPVIVSLHGSCGQLKRYDHPGRNSMDADLLRLIERTSFACATAVHTNSLMNASFWESATKRPIAILPPLMAEIPNPDSNVRKRSSEGIVVGRFQNWKGSRVLCKALSLLSDERVHWFGKDVVNVPTGVAHSDLLRQEFPGIIGSRLILEGMRSKEEILAGIASAAYLCVPSEWDVFNLTVIEAMSLGTPVICSQKAGASMLIEHGVNGFLFDPEKTEEFVAAIQAVLRLNEFEKKSLTENALQTLRGRLNPDQVLSERIAYYHDRIVAFSNWQSDEWLKEALSPREDLGERLEQLRSFTVRELIAAAGQQVVDGIKRRLT